MKIFLKAGLIFGILCCFFSARIDGAESATSKSNCTLDQLTQNTEQFKESHLIHIAKIKGSTNKFHERPGSLLTKDNTISNITTIYGKNELIKCCTSSSFLVNTKTITLFERVLDIKKISGSEHEKELYKGMENTTFVNRLLTQRPLAIVNDNGDKALLRDKENPGGSFDQCYAGNDWHLVGTHKQEKRLPLINYLSQDEVGLSSLLPIASKTVFINNGYRSEGSTTQLGHAGKEGTYQKCGYCVGLVGVRFERETAEFPYMIITKTQNTAKNGYGLSAVPVGLLAAWSEFYEEKFPTFEEAQNNPNKYVQIPGTDNYFNISIYKKRMIYTVSIYINYAIAKAKKQGKPAHIRIPGIGLGPWAASQKFIPTQTKFFVEACFEALTSISTEDIKHISKFEFLWLDPFDNQKAIAPNITEKFAFKSGNTDVNKIVGNHILGNDIEVMFSMNNIASPIGKENLLVTSYAWDGNAFVGNEYYVFMFHSSGDPVAACCSSILYSQNPLINPCLLENNVRKVKKIEESLKTEQKKLIEKAEKINKNNKLVQAFLNISGTNEQLYRLQEVAKLSQDKARSLQDNVDRQALELKQKDQDLEQIKASYEQAENRANILQQQGITDSDKLAAQENVLKEQSEEYKKILDKNAKLEDILKKLQSDNDFQQSIFFFLYKHQGKVAGITGLFATGFLALWLWTHGYFDQFISKAKLA